jgi:hypothetical protein
MELPASAPAPASALFVPPPVTGEEARTAEALAQWIRGQGNQEVLSIHMAPFYNLPDGTTHKNAIRTGGRKTKGFVALFPELLEWSENRGGTIHSKRARPPPPVPAPAPFALDGPPLELTAHKNKARGGSMRHHAEVVDVDYEHESFRIRMLNEDKTARKQALLKNGFTEKRDRVPRVVNDDDDGDCEAYNSGDDDSDEDR